MSHNSLWQQWQRFFRHERQARKSQKRCRLRLEQLESRDVPSGPPGGCGIPPVAVADTISTDTDDFSATGQVSGNLLSNDYDPDPGDTIAATKLNDLYISGGTGNMVVGVYGTMQLNADGSFTYTIDLDDPDTQSLAENAVVTDHFTYTISDGCGLTATADADVQVQEARMRIRISFGEGLTYRRNQNPAIVMFVDITTPTPNRTVVLHMDTNTGFEHRYALTEADARNGNTIAQGTTPIRTGANRTVRVFIRIDDFNGAGMGGSHLWVVTGQGFLDGRAPDGYIIQ